jgi:uncharacterized repeat protein (TIGR02543 family)
MLCERQTMIRRRITCFCGLIVLLALSALVASRPAEAGTHSAGSSGNRAISAVLFETSDDPDIEVWYGLDQRFGHLGNPQRWVNILGNVSDPDGVASLTYSLNGAEELELSIGPNGDRLVATGDFNVEIDRSDLLPGTNQVVISAMDDLGHTSSRTVTVEYVGGVVWRRPYPIDWSSVGGIENVQDVAQIVDGLWTIEGDHIRPDGANIYSYDRLVAIGDTSWLDYEVSVPVTIHQFFGIGEKDPGVGILVRWNGHGDDSEQPHYAHPFGGLGWFRYPWFSDHGRLAILGNENYLIARDDSGRQLELEVPYTFEIRVETKPDGRSYYSFKVWEVDDAEPATWDLSGYGKNAYDYEGHGSLLLVAHRTDASFGDITVTPPLTVEIVGGGTVTMDPDQANHHYGDVVTLTASAHPGWSFTGWDGDLTGTENPASITLDDNKSVTATFVQDEFSLDITIEGRGTVTKEPDLPIYQGDSQVTLAAAAEDGWSFAEWSGDISSTKNPETVTMDDHKTVAASFVTYPTFVPLVLR